MSGMGSHQSTSADSHVWLTPPAILAALGPFDLDPCACTDRPWDTARRHISLPEDGLAAEWDGRVWLNPPYGPYVGEWLSRLAAHGAGTALVFARTETSWFFSQIWYKATAVLFIKGRLHFLRSDGMRARANAGAPSCLVAYGEMDADILSACGINGAYIRLR